MKKKEENVYEIDVLKLLLALWREKVKLILVSVLCAAVMVAYSFFLITPLYTSDVSIYVNNISKGDGNTISTTELYAAQSLVDTYIAILNSRTTLLEVIDELKLDYSAQELSKKIEAKAVNNTEIFNVKVTTDDPAQSKNIANCIARVLPGKIGAVVDGSSVKVVDHPLEAKAPSSPNIPKNGIAGFMIGFMIMAIILIIKELTDDVLRDEDDITSRFDYPILATIPNLFRDKQNSQRDTNEYAYYSYAHDNAKEKEEKKPARNNRTKEDK